MKKTDRTNKTGLTVTWPKGLFIIEECNKLNPDFVNITLRKRITNAIQEGLVNEVAYLHNGKGRPRLVLVHGPITQEHIAEAQSKGMVLKSGLTANVSNTNKTEQNQSSEQEQTENVVCLETVDSEQNIVTH